MKRIDGIAVLDPLIVRNHQRRALINLSEYVTEYVAEEVYKCFHHIC
jgi:hypothetical protein